MMIRKHSATYTGDAVIGHPRRHIIARVIIILLAVASMVPLAFTSVASTMTKPANADLVQYLMCSWDTDPKDDDVPLIKLLYETATTEDLQRQIYYKSQAGADFEDTSQSVFNLISAKDYKKVQLDILNNANATSTKYTPYDRFGFSGLNFTDYNGEWNWYKIYFCRANGKGTGDAKDPEDGHLNDYYKDRDRPLDTWAGRMSSYDPRVKQRANVWLFMNNSTLVIANIVFSIAKFLTALTNMLLQLTLSDVANNLGVVKMVGGDSGIFVNLFNNLFMTLISMMLVMTAAWMLYKGIIKGQVREAYGGLGQFLACFFIGIVMMVNPTFCVNLPNTIGLFGQDLLLQGISNAESPKDRDFCTTNVKDLQVKPTWVDPTGDIEADGKSMAAEFAKSSDAIARSVECEYWRIFALTPYSLGQYNRNPSELYAKDKAPSDGSSIDKTVPEGSAWKADYAGMASVPLGNNQILNNWLVYQISTQNSYHIDSSTLDPKTEKMEKPDTPFTDPAQYQSQMLIVDGANSDWWRVVDALANYKSNKSPGSDTNNAAENSSQKTSDTTAKPTGIWNDWIGGNNANRLLIALMACVFGVVGMIGPISIGFSVVAYAIGSVFVMAFAPLAMTFGMWAGERGKSIVKGWMSLIMNVVLKRMLLGFVFMIMSIFIIKIAGGVEDTLGYFKSMVLICIVSYVFHKNKRTIIKLLGQTAPMKGAFDLQGNADMLANSASNKVEFGKDLAMGGIVGGLSGLKHDIGTRKGAIKHSGKGGKDRTEYEKGHSSVTRGMAKGIEAVLNNHAYSYANENNGSNVGNAFIEAKRKAQESRAGGRSNQTLYCSACGKLIARRGQKMRDSNYGYTRTGQTLCSECYQLAQSGQLPQFQV